MGNADYTKRSVDQVIVNINKVIFGKKYDATLALCKRYAALAQRTARDSQGLEQGGGQFWTNRTRMAVKSMFGYTIADNEAVGFGLAHGMEYGKYLEFANNRKHSMLEKTVRVLTPQFLDELQRIYADT
jgi:hypothetical protein